LIAEPVCSFLAPVGQHCKPALYKATRAKQTAREACFALSKWRSRHRTKTRAFSLGHCEKWRLIPEARRLGCGRLSGSHAPAAATIQQGWARCPREGRALTGSSARGEWKGPRPSPSAPPYSTAGKRWAWEKRNKPLGERSRRPLPWRTLASEVVPT